VRKFHGDDSPRLKAVQHDLSPGSAAAIFESAHQAMVLADTVLMTDLELATRAKACEGPAG